MSLISAARNSAVALAAIGVVSDLSDCHRQRGGALVADRALRRPPTDLPATSNRPSRCPVLRAKRAKAPLRRGRRTQSPPEPIAECLELGRFEAHPQRELAHRE